MRSLHVDVVKASQTFTLLRVACLYARSPLAHHARVDRRGRRARGGRRAARARRYARRSVSRCSQAPLSLPAQVGEKIFADKSLSASGQLACATCHDPAHAYSSPNNLAVQLGGPTMTAPGTRAVPSLRYKEYTTPYADVAPNPDGVSTPGPGGGFTWDGRADTLADQAQIPLLAPNEMANASPADVVTKLQSSAYAALFRAAFGSDAFSSTSDAFQDALNALQAYQLEDNGFHPYTSRFDLNADNKIGGALTASEQRGFEVFMDANRGNCFACHFSGPGNNGSTAMFTDFTYEAIGVPRNPAIPANADPGYFDMGICSRADHPLPDSAPFCGLFKVPTLRNVAIRKVFFHDGIFTSLRQVLNFYNTRDTQPQLWYPVLNGVVQKFNDLPAPYQVNIDTQVAARWTGRRFSAADVAAGPRRSRGVSRHAHRRRRRESGDLDAGRSRARAGRIGDATAPADAVGGGVLDRRSVGREEQRARERAQGRLVVDVIADGGAVGHVDERAGARTGYTDLRQSVALARTRLPFFNARRWIVGVPPSFCLLSRRRPPVARCCS